MGGRVLSAMTIEHFVLRLPSYDAKQVRGSIIVAVFLPEKRPETSDSEPSSSTIPTWMCR